MRGRGMRGEGEEGEGAAAGESTSGLGDDCNNIADI